MEKYKEGKGGGLGLHTETYRDSHAEASPSPRIEAGLSPHTEAGLHSRTEAGLNSNAEAGLNWRTAADCLRIGVASLIPGAGATLLTICAAGYFAERKASVSVLELGSGAIYDSLAMNRWFSLKEFHSFYKAAAGNASLRRLSNTDKGVNWAVKLPEEREKSLDYREALRLVYGVSGQAALFDFSGREDEDAWRLLREMDTILLVVDPLPQRLMAGWSNLERWKLSGLPVRYVVNKDCRGIEWKELTRFLKTKEAERIPFLSPELLYAAQYAGQNPWEKEELRTQLLPSFDRLFKGYL